MFKVEHVEAVQHNRKGQYFVPLAFHSANAELIIDCQLDTGATCNVITYRDVCYVQQIGNPVLQATRTKLKFYDGSLVHILGEYNAKCKHKGNLYQLNFKVIEDDQRPLLSGITCQELGLIKLDMVNAVQTTEIIDQYRDVFEGLGCLEGEYHIELDPKITLLQQAPRRVPVALKEQLKKLDDLTRQGIIQPVTGHTAWISNLVVIKKLGKLRMCIDPRVECRGGNRVSRVCN